jgi:hypothetical protein
MFAAIQFENPCRVYVKKVANQGVQNDKYTTFMDKPTQSAQENMK